MVFGLLTGLAFEEAGNGGCFSLVPHVPPTSNGKQIDTTLSLKIIATIADCCVGLITGVTGAAGDLGGILFLLIVRNNGQDYGKIFWIIGVITIAGNALVSWKRSIPKGQLGSR